MDPVISIRPARPDEQAMLEALQRRASLAWPDYREALLQHPEAIALPLEQIEDGHVHVCERDGIVQGFMAVLPRVDGQAELDGLFVDPPAWRSGSGRRLVATAQALAIDRGASLLHVVASPRAQQFYEACGFIVSGSEQTRFGPAIGMTMPLSPGG